MRVSGGVGQPSKRMHVCMLSRFSHVRLCDPMDCTHQAALSMGILQQEYWSRPLCPPPGESMFQKEEKHMQRKRGGEKQGWEELQVYSGGAEAENCVR